MEDNLPLNERKDDDDVANQPNQGETLKEQSELINQTINTSTWQIRQHEKQKTKFRPIKNPLYAHLDGYLWKQGAGTLKVWKKRWFVLKDNRLYYSKDPNMKAINYILLSVDTKVNVAVEKKFQHCLQLESPTTGRCYYLGADNGAELKRWILGLREIILKLEDRFAQQKEFLSKYLILGNKDDLNNNSSESLHSDIASSQPLIGPSKNREVLDVLISKLELSELIGGAYIVITFGKQKFKTWKWTRKEKTKLENIGCTFTEEGSGEGGLKGKLKIALYQTYNFYSDECLGEYCIDLAELPTGQLLTRSFTFFFEWVGKRKKGG